MTSERKKALRIAIPAPLRQYFDYLPPENGDGEHLKPGMRVKVPFQRRELVGIFMGFTNTPDIAWGRLKQVLTILDTEPVISDDILQLCFWAMDYYHYPLGEVLANALPVLLRKGKPIPTLPVMILNGEGRRNSVLEIFSNEKSPASLCSAPPPFRIITGHAFSKGVKHQLNSAQQQSVSAIQAAAGFQVFLLNGVTGSGKTEVYLEAIHHFLKEDKQILVLVPEIGLTPQTIQRFRDRFSVAVIALHSGLTEKERLQAWNLSRVGEAKIIIGTRSAIFSPFKNLGLIIIDEEHDLSFKQQEGFRYHARDLAIMRAHFANIPIVLGSATPAFDTLFKAEQGKFQHLLLPERAGNAELPAFEVVDIRNKPLEHGLSQALRNEIKTHLDNQNQVMLFLNRRGFAPIILCHSCGWMVNCKRCDMRMTYHQHSKNLRCHHCDSQKPLPKQCEVCQSSELLPIGLGTEKLEMALEKYFPGVSIARIDRDSTQRKGSMEKLLDRIQSGEARILIGTQMLAKGHHFPNVTLVAIVDADGGFFSSDFRALERMGQLLIQVAGRAGRMEKPGKVMIQTHHPDHPLLHQLFSENYQQFAKTILQERKAAALPPYAFFALFRSEAYQLEHASEFLQQIKQLIPKADKNVQVLGPIPAPMAKRAGRHRVQLLVQAKHRPKLQLFLKNIIPQIEKIRLKHRVRWSLDVDPMEMF